MIRQRYKTGKLRIEIGQGVLNFREPDGTVINNFYNDTICPMGSRQYNAASVKGLPPIEVMYRLMQKLGYDNERIIDELLALYHQYRNFKVDYLEDTPMTLGFIGYKRIGKSASIAKVIYEDNLLAGRSVWSNIPFECEVYYKEASKIFKSEPMEKLELLDDKEEIQDGVVVVDEVNMEMADATKYMSNTNLDFSNQLQMAGKKGLDILWSAQNWMTIDPRLKFQSDYITLCSCENPSTRGIMTYWRVMDTTGLSGKLDFDLEMRSHYLLDKVVMEGNAFIRPWWLSYPSGKILGQGRYLKRDIEKDLADDFFTSVYGYALDLAKSGLTPVAKSEVEQKYYENFREGQGGSFRAFQTILGQAFGMAGYKSSRATRRQGACYKLEGDEEE